MRTLSLAILLLALSAFAEEDAGSNIRGRVAKDDAEAGDADGVKGEADKLAAEKREAEKREAEKREAEKREAEKKEAEKRAEEERREAERLEAEKRSAAEKRNSGDKQPEEGERGAADSKGESQSVEKKVKVERRSDRSIVGFGEKVEISSFSIESSSDASLSSWILSSRAKFAHDGIRLLDNLSGGRASMWNTVPIKGVQRFDVELEITSTGLPNGTADGFALWLVDEDPHNFLRQPSPQVWNLFGYRPDFKGISVFFSQTDRSNKPVASVSLGRGDGVKMWDPVKDVPSAEGIYSPIANGDGALRVWVSIAEGEIAGSVKFQNEKDWKLAFQTKVSRDLSDVMYLGITGSNRRDIEAGSLPSPTGHSIYISRLRVMSDLRHFHDSPKLSEDLSHSDLSRLIADSLINNLIPRQEHLLSELYRVSKANQILSDRVEWLHQHLTKGQTEQKIQSALDQIAVVVDKSSKENVEKILELHGKLVEGKEDEKAFREHELALVQSHTRWTTYLTVGIGALVTLTGALTYKRMRDMEKKHIL